MAPATAIDSKKRKRKSASKSHKEDPVAAVTETASASKSTTGKARKPGKSTKRKHEPEEEEEEEEEAEDEVMSDGNEEVESEDKADSEDESAADVEGGAELDVDALNSRVSLPTTGDPETFDQLQLSEKTQKAIQKMRFTNMTEGSLIELYFTWESCLADSSISSEKDDSAAPRWPRRSRCRYAIDILFVRLR